MENPRRYGKAPYKTAVLHGGPGAPGSMAPVARELGLGRGVLEPLQTAMSIEGQVQELSDLLEEHAEPPVVLIGSSWGAMLGFVFAARHRRLVRKLIMVGSGVFEEKYASQIMATRMGRLSRAQQRQAAALQRALSDPEGTDKDSLMAGLGDLLAEADAFDPVSLATEVIQCQWDLHNRVWQQAVELRANGGLLALGEKIRCPVVAIHGDHDPHPAAGVQEPLSALLERFRFVLIERCGHTPCIERQARDRFYQVLQSELRQDI